MAYVKPAFSKEPTMKWLGITLSFFVACLMVGTTALAQATGGPGAVVAVQENGMATVRIGNQELTVKLLGAQVGDKVVCTATNDNIEWKCRLHQG
jgi:hypothetical protein